MATAQWETVPPGLPDRIAPTLLNGWANAGGAITDAYYRRDDQGRVTLGGTLINAASNATALTLPVGFRPIEDSFFKCHATVAGVPSQQTIEIDSDGNVTPVGAGAPTAISFDGINFAVT